MCAGDNVEKELLLQTIGMLESLNLMELVPVEASAWYETEKFRQEQEEQSRERASNQLLEKTDPSAEK